MTWCPGGGSPAVAVRGSVYPTCPVCGRDFGAQGRKAQRRYENAWRCLPRHAVPPDAAPPEQVVSR